MASLARSALSTAVRASRVGGPSTVRAVAARSVPFARSIASGTPRLDAEVHAGAPLTQTNRAEITLRRFWKNAHIKEDDGGYLVTLDHRNLKTPSGTKLVVPANRRLLAILIANEWENQEQVLKQHALPLTSLASRAIDGLSDPKTREAVIDSLLSYLETDTICYPDEAPDALVRLQKEHWDPLFKWLKDKYGVTLNLAEGFSPANQDPATVEKLRSVIEGFDIWELAAFERAVYATKSFVIALALVTGRISANEAAQASHVEVASQIERWGEVEDTHDVDHQDIRRALGSVATLLAKV
ncbi:hypothetical protein VHUM_01361 [Vanrija humicola]|uniref:ATP synthase mitochondrial F1 complex assembly factor 2 n=1 Tax=Vanrija humicola TaxID=5417 RepID=A0A7D8V184_VANHU|nr:hypothetical protein VHUM_01361 [Vanrija humicola]